ncbi:MAG: hypothetical protein C4547_08155 [Phycisphaerales bacterium]|nr:MAG: hypothetical protein C4547_08155 [Phycisphaerales bacterium]
MPIIARATTPHPRRRRRLRSMRFLPSVLTLGNLLCGFAAIYFTQRAMFPLGAGDEIPMSHIRILPRFPSILSFAAGMVFLGMFFDMLDGLAARVTRSTTDFGGQLDSLADMVTCGIAPAALMIAFMLQHFKGDAAPSPISENPFGRLSWACAAAYVALAAVRLARYNVEHAQADFDYRTFRGLPSPGAAGLLCMFIILYDQLPLILSDLATAELLQELLVYAIPGVSLLAGCLMVSSIRYRRFHSYLQGRRPFWQLVTVILLFAAFWAYKTPTLFALMLCYVLSGPTGHFVRILRPGARQREAPTPAATRNGEWRIANNE